VNFGYWQDNVYAGGWMLGLLIVLETFVDKR
jgi:hypothetical protein